MIMFRFYYDSDKEEEFLNKMARRNYEFKKFFLGLYFFKKVEKCDYIYRIDFFDKKTEKEINEYIDFLAESKIDCVERWVKWGYFRKNEDFELYTDTDSKISRYQNIRNMFTLIDIMLYAYLIYMLSILYLVRELTVNTVTFGIIVFMYFLLAATITKHIVNLSKKIKELKYKSK